MGIFKQNQIKKVDISLKQLSDLDTTNALYSDRLDNIRDNQILISGTNQFRKDVFRFKYLTELIQAGSGVTITSSNGVLTISSTGGGGGGVTSIDVDGGTGISVSPAGPITTSGTFTVTNTAPDQTVVLNNGTGISVTGTYPNFTINSTATGVGIKYGVATQTSAGVYTTTITGVTAYTVGDTYVIKFDSVNDGASTLNINTLGAKNIYKNTSTPISSGDIKTDQTVELVYDGTNFQAIGLVSDQLLAYVHNEEGATITKGQVVYAYQASGNKMSVKLAKADSDATSAKTIGLVYDSSIGVGGEGYIIIQGVIEGINTAAFSAGNTLYLSGTTYGGVTNVKPYAPTHLVYVGIVERANAGNGQIYVRCQNGYELDEIHDVDLISTAPANNDVLTYVTGSSNLWKPRSLTTILGYTPVTNARTITINGTTYDLSANRTWSVGDLLSSGSYADPVWLTSLAWSKITGAPSFLTAAITSLNGLTAATQTFATPGTTGTAPSWTSATSTHTLNIPLASASGVTAGLISNTDWNTFNSKASGDSIVFASNPNASHSNTGGSTSYWAITGSLGLGVESARIVVMPCAGTLKNFYVRMGGAASASGSIVMTVRKNGADTSITVTFTSADGSNVTKSDTTNTVSVSAGDRITVGGTNYATAQAGTVVSMSLLLERT